MLNVRNTYLLRSLELKAPGGKTINLKNYSQVKEVFDLCFQDYHQKLKSHSNIGVSNASNQLLDGDGSHCKTQNSEQRKQSNKHNRFQFDVELENILLDSNGVLLPSFNQEHATRLFENYSGGLFDVDWIYMSDIKVVVIEVTSDIDETEFHLIGQKKNLKSSKIHKILQQSLPRIEEVICSLNGKENLEEEQLLVYGIVCIPHTTNKGINEYLSSKKGFHLQKFLSKQCPTKISRVLFATKESFFPNNEEGDLFTLQESNDGFQVARDGLSFKDFFISKSIGTLNEKHHLKVAAYLSLSYLLPEYMIRDRSIKAPGGQIINLSNHSDIEKIFDFYFPDYSKKLCTFPRIHDIPGGVLYGHSDEYGNTCSKSDDYNEAGYTGEVFEFWTKLVGRFEKATGSLFHSLSQVQAMNLFGNYTSQEKFEIDWIYVNDEKVAVIEVGYSETESAASIVGFKGELKKSKIYQTLKNSLPRIQKLIDSITCRLRGAVEEAPYGVICLPGHSNDIINKYLSSESGYQLQKVLAEHSPEELRRLKFITKNTVNVQEIDSVLYDLIYVQEKYQLKDSDCKTADFFKSKKKSARRPDNKTIAAYLQISYLIHTKSKNSQEISIADEPIGTCAGSKSLQSAQKRFIKRFKNMKKFGQFDDTILLSPQQWHILQRNDPYLMIAGKPGTGKTSLLVAKAMKEAENISGYRNKIIFLLPSTKQFLRCELEELFRGSNIQVMTFEPFLPGDINLHSIKLLVVDELDIHVHADIEKHMWRIWTSGAIVWATWLSTSPKSSSAGCLSVEIPRITLNTQFRCASHIAEAVSLIDLFNGNGSDSTTCNVYASGQVSMPVVTFDDIADLPLPIFVSCWSVAVFRNSEILYKFAPTIKQQTWHLIDISEYLNMKQMNVADFHFTGVEYDAVILVLDHFEFSGIPIVADLINSIISRAKFEVHVFLHDSISEEFEFLKFTHPNQKLIKAARLKENNGSVVQKLMSRTLPCENSLMAVLEIALFYNFSLLIDIRLLYQSQPRLSVMHKLRRLQSFDKFGTVELIVAFLEYHPRKKIRIISKTMSKKTQYALESGIFNCELLYFNILLDFSMSFWKKMRCLEDSVMLRRILCLLAEKPDKCVLFIDKIGLSRIDPQKHLLTFTVASGRCIRLAQLLLTVVPSTDRYEYLTNKSDDGNNPIHLAITGLALDSSVIDFIKVFLGKEKEPWYPPDNIPPLHLEKNDSGKTPLLLAIFYGRIEVVKFLLAELKCLCLTDMDDVEEICRALGESTPEMRVAFLEQLPPLDYNNTYEEFLLLFWLLLRCSGMVAMQTH